MSLAQQARVCLLHWNQLEIAVLEFHIANRAMRTQRTQGLPVGANSQAAGIPGPQRGGLPNIHALALARFDQAGQQRGSVAASEENPRWF